MGFYVRNRSAGSGSVLCIGCLDSCRNATLPHAIYDVLQETKSRLRLSFNHSVLQLQQRHGATMPDLSCKSLYPLAGSSSAASLIPCWDAPTRAASAVPIKARLHRLEPQCISCHANQPWIEFGQTPCRSRELCRSRFALSRSEAADLKSSSPQRSVNCSSFVSASNRLPPAADAKFHRDRGSAPT